MKQFTQATGVITALSALIFTSSARAAVIVTASGTASLTDAHDQFFLPGSVEEVDTIAGSGTASGDNDAWTYVAGDRASKGQSFTTGANAGGYSLNSVTVQHVNWPTFVNNGTFYELQSNDTFQIRFGTISGTTLTSLFTTTATYAGADLGFGNNSGTGTYLTFDLTGEAVPTLGANTTYFFEIASNNLFIELNSVGSTSTYSSGTAFSGNGPNGLLDDDLEVNLAPAGDLAFHAELAAIPEPGSVVLGGLGMLTLFLRRRS